MNRDKGREILKIEAEAVLSLAERLGREFDTAIQAIVGCKGHLVVTGMGKAGLVGQKISATFASTGTPSIFLHPAEAYHGDLGRVLAADVVLAISNSGETEEVTRLLPSLKQIGARLVSPPGCVCSSVLSRRSKCLEFARGWIIWRSRVSCVTRPTASR